MARHERRYCRSIRVEHFIVWMRAAGLPTFRKHWGRIESGLSPGDYRISVVNNYDVSGFSGEKHLVFTTVNAFGGSNYLLGGFFIGVGVLSLILCILFIVAFKIKQSKEIITVIRNPQNLSEVLFND
eukprot:TRINITY_DN9574_c0_g2_i2.p1 TRINITY_DN9574_c0_g2~~TRINITY_DN9574_c0_g2_i2.p1  ORF type:complete len:127 (+),score=6.13 TRINITY_DN9574_c0_g2_i2:791-1171(+)